MVKKEYLTPEVDVVILKTAKPVLLTTSTDETPGIGGTGDPDDEAG